MTQLKRETLAHHTMALIGGFFGLYALFTRGGTFGSSETSNLIYLLVSGLTGSVEDFLIRLGGTGCYIAGIVFASLGKRYCRRVDFRYFALAVDAGACVLLALIPAEIDPVLSLSPMFFATAVQWLAYTQAGDVEYVLLAEVHAVRGSLPVLAGVWAASLLFVLAAGGLVCRAMCQTYDRQAALERSRRDTTNALAHDLKTPLTSIIGYLTLLRDEPQVSPELRAKYTGIALDKADRLEELINEFFEITRFNLSHLELERTPVDLSRMLGQLSSEFEPALRDKELSCETELPARLEYICDPDKLARVFDNLLRNACHYSTAGTTVQIAAQSGESGIVLTFTNQGITIPEEKLERIFEQFFRLDASRATRTGGAGLGLAIAKEIIELHGGTISARSAGNVTTFTVVLPAP